MGITRKIREWLQARRLNYLHRDPEAKVTYVCNGILVLSNCVALLSVVLHDGFYLMVAIVFAFVAVVIDCMFGKGFRPF